MRKTVASLYLRELLMLALVDAHIVRGIQTLAASASRCSPPEAKAWQRRFPLVNEAQR